MSILSTGLGRDERKARLAGGAGTNRGPPPLTVSVNTACRLLDVGPTTMWAMIADGRVKSIKVGRKRLVVYTSLEALVAGEDEETTP